MAPPLGSRFSGLPRFRQPRMVALPTLGRNSKIKVRMSRLRFLPLLLLLGVTSGTSTTLAATDPDQSCAHCHQKIFDSYQKTPMARASGAAIDGLLPGEFTHAASGVRYQLFLRDGRAWLSYDRPNAPPERALKGEQELSYFIGSGQRGRTYLFQKHGYWFESPVNWYSKQRVWDMNPKSLDAQEMPFTLKVDGGCLHCHSTGVQPSLGAVNHFGAQPFLYGGITCRSCHGDPAAHLKSGGAAPILNPAKLSPTKRDSVCLQCHLEGETAVNAPGRSLAAFVPGQDLLEYVTHFVHSGELGPEGRATSQWEALLQSECKKKSGDRLTCTTCHDPHNSPSAEERVSYFRSRCLTCHGASAFVNKHHPEQPDCSGCHMPREKTGDVAHEQVTDHRIQRRPAPSSSQLQARTGDLSLVGGGKASDRDLGLAYFQMANHGDQAAGNRAMQLLKQAERQRGEPPDPDLHTALGFMAHLSGDRQTAIREYEAALAANPADSVAAGDLAILEARAGDAKSAINRLQGISENDPGEIRAGMDLAMIECAVGDPQAATTALRHLLEFSPDDAKARNLLAAIETKPETCHH
jgi:tetratricopeptide repeat protein/cytochrome c554/c'-like protein